MKENNLLFSLKGSETDIARIMFQVFINKKNQSNIDVLPTLT